MIEALEIKRQLKIDKSNWTLVKLGDLAEDISIRVDNPAQSGYDRFVGLEHFVSGDLKIKSWGTTENLTSAAKAFQKGDILFARRNAYLRRASLVNFDGICSGDAFVIRENHNKVVPGFLAFLMNSNALWDYANANAAGTMSKRVKWRDLAEFEFLLSPIDQQKQIAELLWAGDGNAESFSKVHSQLVTLKSAFNKKYFSNYLKSKLKIGDFTSKVGSGTTPKGGNKVYQSEGVRFIRSQNVLSGKMDFNDVAYISDAIDTKMRSTRVFKEDVLLNITGASIGRSAVYLDELPANVNQHVCILRTTESLCPGFLMEFMNSEYGQQQVQSLQAGGNREGLNFANIKLMKFPEYDKTQQLEIMKRYDSLNNALIATENQLANIKNLQMSFINQIF